MSLSLTVLGCNAAMPAHGRITSAQVLKSKHHLYLIDCGEGTQIRFNQYKIKRNKIQVICISHLHGDHIYGLPGVLSSYFYFSRTTKLTIIGPVGTKQFIHSFLEATSLQLAYPIEFIEHSATNLSQVYENEDLIIQAFPLKHRIVTNGYLFKEKPAPRNIRKEKIAAFNLSVPEIIALKSGKDVIRPDGQTIVADQVLHQTTMPQSYAYCSDTVYDTSLIDIVKNVSLLYHETTYLHALQQKAKDRMHSTSLEAARIALAAQVKQLMIGHYSGIYRKPDLLLEEATSVFENSIAAYDGLMVDID